MKHLANPIKSALRTAFQRQGYRFHRGNWIRDCDEVIQLVNLQCEYGAKNFLNVAIWIRALGQPSYLQEQFGQFRFRLSGQIAPEFDELLFVYLNEHEIPPEERETRLRTLLERVAIPLLDRLTTVDDLRSAYLQNCIGNVAIVWQASLYLFGTESPPPVS